MYQVLSKFTIESEIVPYIPLGKRVFKSKVPICEIINCILYKLKTGIQWYPKIDLSSGDVDDSHTTALRGGEAVGYQDRKKRKPITIYE